MSEFGYLQNDAAIRRESARRLDPPDFGPDYCDLCGKLEEDCENGYGCVRCAICKCKPGDCGEDCGFHLEGCDFPSDRCRCKSIKAQFAAKAEDAAIEDALDAHRFKSDEN